MILAATEEGVIGHQGSLPWRLKTDLGRFRRLTLGHPVVMGRATFESIGRALPGRTNIVVTRRRDYEAAGAEVVGDFESAVDRARAVGSDECFLIGGRSLFRWGLDRVDRIYLTTVLVAVPGDEMIELPSRDLWKTTARERVPADDDNEYPTVFEILDRRQPAAPGFS